MTYARLISPTQVQPAPPTWAWPDGRTTSNFHLSTPAVLAEAGFLPYVEADPPDYDPDTQTVAASYAEAGGRVVQSWTVENLPAEQVAAIARQKAYQAWFDAQDFGALTGTLAKTEAIAKALITKGTLTAKEISDAAVAVEAPPAEEPLEP
jgi:hypothetical protein